MSEPDTQISSGEGGGEPTAEQLRDHGYAPGGYMVKCRDCGEHPWDLDKRATRCKACATAAWRKYSMVAALAAPAAKGGTDPLVAYLERQWSWSKETFGPALRTKGIVQHITKELREIEADPHDLAEWVDVIILAMDGFWRHGGKPSDLLPAMQAKQDRNFARTWPDWRTMGEDQAIEHDRSGEDSPPPPAGAAGGGSGDLGALIDAATDAAYQCRERALMRDELSKGTLRAAADVIDALSKHLIEAPTPDLGAQGEPVVENVAQIIAHNLCGYVDEVDSENFLSVALTTAHKILALVCSTSQTARSVWAKAYEAECHRAGADFNVQACIAENFPQIVIPQQPAAQGELVGREAVLAVVRAAWALVDNTGHHDLLPLAVNRDDWNDLGARLAALKALLPAEELPADPPHAVAYFWPTSSSIDTERAPDLRAQGEPVAWLWEHVDKSGAWYEIASVEKPNPEGRRNIRPLGLIEVAAPSPIKQEEPAAWAYEELRTRTFDTWEPALSYDRPKPASWFRNIEPLFKQAPAAPRSGSGVTVEGIAAALFDHDERLRDPKDHGVSWATWLSFIERYNSGSRRAEVEAYRSRARAILALLQAPRPGETGDAARVKYLEAVLGQIADARAKNAASGFPQGLHPDPATWMEEQARTALFAPSQPHTAQSEGGER